ncbi:MAG: hypothetical protein ACRDCC_09845 [Culicoidibacterales bacterium]
MNFTAEPEQEAMNSYNSYNKRSSMNSEEREELKEYLASVYFESRRGEIEISEDIDILRDKYNFISAELNKLMRNYKDKRANLENVRKKYVHEFALLVLAEHEKGGANK